MKKKGNIVGNNYDKYGTKNPIAKYLMAGFFKSVNRCCNTSKPMSVLEVGCGEGNLIINIINNSMIKPEKVIACDVSLEKIKEENLMSEIIFEEASIYDLPYADNEFDLVICCEVLEHLELPEDGISELIRVTNKSLIISTPREPIWRLLNIFRGKYLLDCGNTPGHIQHFSKKKLISLVSDKMSIKTVLSPIPWTVILAEKIS